MNSKFLISFKPVKIEKKGRTEWYCGSASKSARIPVYRKKIKIGVSHYGSMEGGNRRKTAASALNIERSCCKIDIQT